MKKLRINERGGTARGGEYVAPLRDVERIWKSKFLAPFTEPFEHENDDINHKIGHRKRKKIKKPIEKMHDNVNEWVEITEDVILEDLSVWFGKKKKKKGSSQPKGPWVNICKKKKGGGHPPCGREDSDKGGYPECRGAGVAGKMSQSEKDSACRRKRDKVPVFFLPSVVSPSAISVLPKLFITPIGLFILTLPTKDFIGDL